MSQGAVFIIGLVISFLSLETTGIYPGGIIVPGFLALYVQNPARIAATFVIALAVVFMYRFLAGRVLLFGRRRFIFMLISGALLSAGYSLLLARGAPLPVDSRVIGMIIPGLIANNAEKQGVVKTFAAAVIAIALTWLLSRLILSLFGLYK
jgi:poly-gamma-glutamate biosynthesis protein PgsC/CapC